MLVHMRLNGGGGGTHSKRERKDRGCSVSLPLDPVEEKSVIN